MNWTMICVICHWLEMAISAYLMHQCKWGELEQFWAGRQTRNCEGENYPQCNVKICCSTAQRVRFWLEQNAAIYVWMAKQAGPTKIDSSSCTEEQYLLKDDQKSTPLITDG